MTKRQTTTPKPEVRPHRQLVDEHVAAATLGLAVQSLRNARVSRTGVLAELRWHKLGQKAIRPSKFAPRPK